MQSVIDRLETVGRFTRVPWSGCWIWLGALTGKGYGSMSQGRYAHRVFYEAFYGYGSVPDDQMVLHKCDIKCCVNPLHLFVGSHRDNVFDAIRKGRYLDNGKENSSKTHCLRGHEFTEENTYLYRGRRYCKACWRLRYKNAES